MKREEFAKKWGMQPSREYGNALFDCSEALLKDLDSVIKDALPPAEGAEKSCLNCRFHNSPTYHDKMWCRDCQQFNHYEAIKSMAGGAKTCWNCGIELRYSPNGVTAYHCACGAADPGERQQQPTAEGAEEILASLIESLGEPDNSIHDHSYEIRPLTVNGKCEWWMFHNGVGSGEPLAQWLQYFATLHAQRIAEKMVSERLREAPRNCPKAAQCAHVEGGLKCPPNVICPI